MYGDLPEGLPLTDLDLGLDPQPVGVYEPHNIIDLPMDDMDPRDDWLSHGDVPPGTTPEYSGDVDYPDWAEEMADEAYNSIIESTDELSDALGDILDF